MGPCEMNTKIYHAKIPNKQGSKSLRSYGEKFHVERRSKGDGDKQKRGSTKKQPNKARTNRKRKKRVPNKKYVSEIVNTLEDTNSFVQFFTML